MTYDPTDPGPVMTTYDPDWEVRWNAAHQMLEQLRKREDPLRDHEVRSHLTEELCGAYIARFKHSWEYEAFLREQHAVLPPGLAGVSMPSPPYTATAEEMQAHYRRWRDLVVKLKHYQTLPPAVEWDSGLFSMILPEGATRVIRPETISRERMTLPIRMTLVIECHPDATHVCAIQGPKCGTSVMNTIRVVAEWIADQHLPRPSLLSALGRRARRRLFLYNTYTPERFGPPGQPVWGA